MSKKIYYKVMRSDRTSYTGIDLDKKAVVKYKANQWTKPRIKNSSLMVFRSKTHADDFLRCESALNYGYLVIPCHIKKSKLQRRRIPITQTGIQYMRKFWRDNVLLYHDYYVRYLPLGTILADEVFCLK